MNRVILHALIKQSIMDKSWSFGEVGSLNRNRFSARSILHQPFTKIDSSISGTEIISTSIRIQQACARNQRQYSLYKKPLNCLLADALFWRGSFYDLGYVVLAFPSTFPSNHHPRPNLYHHPLTPCHVIAGILEMHLHL